MDSNGEILNSWKQVAAYLGRGTRTVQRWEHDLGLPVLRPRGKSRSAIMALRQDLDAWVRTRPQIFPHGNGHSNTTVYPPNGNGSIRATILESRGLRSQTRRLRKEMSLTILSLVTSLKRIHATGEAVRPQDSPFKD